MNLSNKTTAFCSFQDVLLRRDLLNTTLPFSVPGSHDSTIRLWDLIAGKTRATLTNHKKSVRALALHPRQYVTSSYVVNDDAYDAPKLVIFCYLVVVNDRVDRLVHFICAF